MAKEGTGAEAVQSVDRALDLLEALAASGGPIGITTLAGRAGLHVSTAHRLLATLVRRGWAERDGQTRRYRIARRGPEA